LHLSFDHERLREILGQIPHKWLLTYDECDYIRERYADYTQLRWTLQYGMNNYRQPHARPGKELFIANYDIEGTTARQLTLVLERGGAVYDVLSRRNAESTLNLRKDEAQL
jgi:hypothetical protein